jgi:hypothetical protein
MFHPRPGRVKRRCDLTGIACAQASGSIDDRLLNRDRWARESFSCDGRVRVRILQPVFPTLLPGEL